MNNGFEAMRRAKREHLDTEGHNDAKVESWERLSEVAFSGDKPEEGRDENEALDTKKAELQAAEDAIREKTQERLGGDIKQRARAYKETVDDILAISCWENAIGDRHERREQSLAEIHKIQDFMFLDEANLWLDEGSPAKKRLTELFHKTYCEPSESERLIDNTTPADWALSSELKSIDESVETSIPKLDLDDDEAANNLEMRRNDFLSFAKARLGAGSKEYFFILDATEGQRGIDRFKRNRSIARKTETITDCIGVVGGTETPMRLAASLTRPFGEQL